MENKRKMSAQPNGIYHFPYINFCTPTWITAIKPSTVSVCVQCILSFSFGLHAHKRHKFRMCTTFVYAHHNEKMNSVAVANAQNASQQTPFGSAFAQKHIHAKLLLCLCMAAFSSKNTACVCSFSLRKPNANHAELKSITLSQLICSCHLKTTLGNPPKKPLYDQNCCIKIMLNLVMSFLRRNANEIQEISALVLLILAKFAAKN